MKCHLTFMIFIDEKSYAFRIFFKLPSKEYLISWLDWTDRLILKFFKKRSKNNNWLEGEMAQMLGKALKAENESFWKKKFWQEPKCSIR